MKVKRYTVVAFTERPRRDLFGIRLWPLDGTHTIMGHRAYIESAHGLAERTVDAKDGIYVHAVVRDSEDYLVVAECEREDDEDDDRPAPAA